MSTDIADTVIRLSSPADIIDAVPYLVGFRPADSLVVVSLRGKRHRIGLTARVDLPPAADAAACAREFVGYLKRNQAKRAIIVLYPPSDGPAHPSVRPLADALAEHLLLARIDLSEALCVGDGRWWSLLCTDDACCPHDGTPVAEGTSACAVAMTVNGRVVLESREDLARSIEPLAGAVGPAMAYALPRARAVLADQRAAGLGLAVAVETVALFSAAVSSRLPAELRDPAPGAPGPAVGASDAPAILTVDDAARLIVGLDDVRARDELLGWFDDEWGAATRDLLVDLVRRATPPYEAPPLTVLAWIAYLQGDGAFAGIALDRALTADPDYNLARILEQPLLAALDPEVFRSSMRGRRRGLT